MSKWKYNPDNFKYELADDMRAFYEAYEKGPKSISIYGLVENIHYSAKESMKFREISPELCAEIQAYFWRFV